jgi:hypothetical protein
LLSPSHHVIYHDPLSVSTVAGGIAIDLFIACILSAAGVEVK